MTGFLGRLAIASTVASIPLAAASVSTSAVSSAKPQCDPNVGTHCVTSSPQCDLNWSRNVWTGECHPQPAIPDWYVVRPAYAPPYAPVDAAAASPSAVGTATAAEMGRRFPTMGLGQDLVTR